MFSLIHGIKKISSRKLYLNQCLLSGFTKGFDLLGPEMVDNKQRSMIRAYGETSFLVNNVLVRQSVLLFPNSFLAWKPRKMEEITIESLEVFTLMYPTLEIIFIGCGQRMSQRFPVEIQNHFRKKGIVVEATDTINAAATFNILSSEGRNVAAALLTLQPYEEEDSLEDLLK
jgi:NADH dehydrogenase [ubiquinone] 1 alpha subcomplex assembly factor 3